MRARLRLSWVAVAVLGALFACTKRSVPTTEASDAGLAAASVVAVVPPDAAPRVLHYEKSMASFRDEQLDECLDFVFEVTPPPDAGADWQPKSDPTKDLGKRSGNELTALKKLCTEQFADRVLLASCVVTKASKNDAGAAIEMRMVDSYFNFASVGLSDSYMNDCLKLGGEWKSEPHDGDIWNKARMEHSSNALRRQLK